MTSTSSLTYSKPVADMAARAHQAIDDAAGRTTPAVETASAAAHRTIDRVADTATPAADWVAESSRRIVARSTEIADSCSAQVRSRPLATVAGALAMGYLLGRLLR
jgi:ElaB/YqjD/DUF883 family membrane-anchored ribosome-binding protein